jgi:hypothetical protein
VPVLAGRAGQDRAGHRGTGLPGTIP